MWDDLIYTIVFFCLFDFSTSSAPCSSKSLKLTADIPRASKDNLLSLLNQNNLNPNYNIVCFNVGAKNISKQTSREILKF